MFSHGPGTPHKPSPTALLSSQASRSYSFRSSRSHLHPSRLIFFLQRDTSSAAMTTLSCALGSRARPCRWRRTATTCTRRSTRSTSTLPTPTASSSSTTTTPSGAAGRRVVTRRWMTWTCTTEASPRPLRRSGRSLGGRHPQPRTNLHRPLLLRCGLRGADVQHPHELGAPAPATSPFPLRVGAAGPRRRRLPGVGAPVAECRVWLGVVSASRALRSQTPRRAYARQRFRTGIMGG